MAMIYLYLTERGILEDILIFEYLGFLYLEDHEVLE